MHTQRLRDTIGAGFRETLLKHPMRQQIRRDEDAPTGPAQFRDHIAHSRLPRRDVTHLDRAGAACQHARRRVHLMPGPRIGGSCRGEHHRIATAPSGLAQPFGHDRGQYRIRPQRLRHGYLGVPAQLDVLRNILVHMVSRCQKRRKQHRGPADHGKHLRRRRAHYIHEGGAHRTDTPRYRLGERCDVLYACGRAGSMGHQY
ncbi:Uncharacterised protein [Mycobacteroides abscessus]|nr:Uncharacterised protein [Mycobacteroides abscessus]